MMQVSAADMREFAKYDHDQSSFLDMAEFIAALKADRFNKQVSDEEAMEIFKMADIDGDGKISMNEFHTMKSLNLSTGRREHLSLSHSRTLETCVCVSANVSGVVPRDWCAHSRDLCACECPCACRCPT